MNNSPIPLAQNLLNKVPEVTISFWVIKLLSTTVGETCADFLAVNAGFGQIVTFSVMGAFLLVTLIFQFRSKKCVPWIYWLAVVLVSIVGTQITDALTDKLGISLSVSASVFVVILGCIFTVWYRSEGTLAIQSIDTRSREIFYWCAILCTFALGTAAGDLATEGLGLGFRMGVIIFGAMIGIAALAYRFKANNVLVFWIAYILTRPLGAALGDFMTQASEYGGMGLGAKWTSIIFLAVIASLVARAQATEKRSLLMS